MKALLALCTLAASQLAIAQTDRPLRLWVEKNCHGYLQQSFTEAGDVEMLPYVVRGKVSSLEVAKGYTVTFFQREDLEGPASFTAFGPCRINDLAALPAMTFKPNWDNGIGSLRISRVQEDADERPAVIAELQP